MVHICLTSTSEIKENIVKKYFCGENDNIAKIKVSTPYEQPYGINKNRNIRNSIYCAYKRINNIEECYKYDFIIAIENGIIQFSENPNTYIDITDIIIYNCKEKKFYTTENMPIDEMIKIPIPLGNPSRTSINQPLKINIEDKYNIIDKTVGQQIAKEYNFYKYSSDKDICIYDSQNWMRHLGMDRHIQIEKSFEYVFNSMKCNLQNPIKDKVILTPNFPEKGVLFQDYQNVFGDITLKKNISSYFCSNISKCNNNYNIIVAGPELRGYMGTYIADILECNHTMIRKKKGDRKIKMAGNVVYSDLEEKEYNDASCKEQFYCLRETFKDKNVILFDDVLATGGSIIACCNLVEKCGGKVIKLCFLADVPELREKTKNKLIKYGYFNIIDIVFNSESLSL